jgi:hypothetical protein
MVSHESVLALASESSSAPCTGASSPLSTPLSAAPPSDICTCCVRIMPLSDHSRVFVFSQTI